MSSKQERNVIKRELSMLSCPFTWQLANVSVRYRKKISYTKESNDNIDEEGYLYLEKLISSLVILYEKVIFAEINRAQIKLNKCQQLLLELQDKHEDEDIMRVIKHIFYSTKCYYLFEINDIKQLKIILPTIVKTSDFTSIELAALAGCQSIAWSMFGNFGRKEAMDLAGQAIQQNSDKALWHFIFAKNIRRDRRLTAFNSPPAEVEKQHFKLAYQKSPNPVFSIYLVRMFNECIISVPPTERKNLEKLLLIIYKEILALSDNNYRVLPKLALGFMHLKTTSQLKLAKYCLDTIEKIAPNDSTYLHYKGMYAEKMKNIEEALKFYKKSGKLYNYAAEMDYVRLGCKAKLLDPLTHLQSMLVKYKKIDNERDQEIHLCIAQCYYEKKNYQQAMEYYLKAIEVDPNNAKLKTQQTVFNSTIKHKNGIYTFLKLKFLKLAKNCNEYRCEDDIFIIIYNRLQNLCNLYG